MRPQSLPPQWYSSSNKASPPNSAPTSGAIIQTGIRIQITTSQFWVPYLIPCFSINGAHVVLNHGQMFSNSITKLMFLYFKSLIWPFVLVCFCSFKVPQKLKTRLGNFGG